MKNICALMLLSFIWSQAKADHISGGEVYYTVTDVGSQQYRYNVTIKLFMVCNSGRQFNNPATISLFSRSSGGRVLDITVPLSRQERLSLENSNPCITNPPTVCYHVGYYEFEVMPPPSPDGYFITCQVVFRINGISNLIFNYGNIGATYTAEIPGVATTPNAHLNNSARFTGNDLVMVCAFNSFSYSFAATDADGDELRYSFCNAYQGGLGGFGDNARPPQAPPYASVPYSSSFSGSLPLGSNVRIDSRTGMITGIAPSPGVYVVTVCVEEIRDGKVIATQRKDLQINITSCSIASATIPPEYMLCKDSREILLQNYSNSPLINSFNWELSDLAGNILFTSSQRTDTYNFPDTGLYRVKLVVNRNGTCTDSSVSIARVYPGFNPDFSYEGICVNNPTNFTQNSTTLYGEVNYWDWDFGDISLGDFSSDPNPSYTYTLMGNKEVRMVAGNSMGCIDTIRKTIGIVTKPPLDLLFNDTLICVNDQVQLVSGATGLLRWSPQFALDNPASRTPVAAPVATTRYYVDVDDNGCVNRDSVLVRVVNKVDLNIMNDTTICAGDEVRLRLTSNAFQYSWSPASQLDDPHSMLPLSTTSSATRYSVFAQLGGCSAEGSVLINTVPYPHVYAGADTVICYNSSAILNGNTDGSSFVWSPLSAISNYNSLQPVVRPISSTRYVLSAYDTRGCPKPSRDTVLVTVLPQIIAYAGADTSVIINQPLQLGASGGIRYEWSPAYGLSATDIANPVAVYTNSDAGFRYKVVVYNEAGCYDTASVGVKIFASGPNIFVPNAFTPNGDGINDLFRIVAVGIRKLETLQVFNRWGQLVFQTANTEAGWDGNVGGMPAASGTYVWMVKAVDFLGEIYMRRGTVTLLR